MVHQLTVQLVNGILVCGNNIGSICNRKLMHREMPSKQRTVLSDRFHIGFFCCVSMPFTVLLLSCKLTPVTPNSEDLPHKWIVLLPDLIANREGSCFPATINV